MGMIKSSLTFGFMTILNSLQTVHPLLLIPRLDYSPNSPNAAGIRAANIRTSLAMGLEDYGVGDLALAVPLGP